VSRTPELAAAPNIYFYGPDDEVPVNPKPNNLRFQQPKPRPASYLALTLLMAGIAADHENHAATAHDFAMFTNAFYAGTDFHDLF